MTEFEQWADAVAARLEAMHKNNIVWISTLAAANIARNTPTKMVTPLCIARETQQQRKEAHMGKEADQVEFAQPLTVRIRSYPESNGKRNWTADFVRVSPFEGLVGTAGGVTIDHGEYWNRVAYTAERARFLLGERATEPSIREYGEDVRTPEEWKGNDPEALTPEKESRQEHPKLMELARDAFHAGITKNFVAMGKIEERVMTLYAPDMFWNFDSPEKQYRGIGEILADALDYGTLAVGDTLVVLQAKQLPKVEVRVTAIDADGYDIQWEYVQEGAPQDTP